MPRARDAARVLAALLRAGLCSGPCAALLACLLTSLWASGAAAGSEGADGQVVAVDYDRLAATLGGRVDFETGPTVPEPGQRVLGPYRQGGVEIAEVFTGQSLIVATNPLGQTFDALSGAPDAPLSLARDSDRETLALAAHRGLGSMAAFPLGPAGFPDIAGRGEGAMAVRFDTPQAATGLRLHAGYADPLGARPPPGPVLFTFYGSDAAVLGRVMHRPEPGVIPLAWEFRNGALAGFTLTTTDPGGIALDDILYAPARPSS